MASNSPLFLLCAFAIWVFHFAPAGSSSAHHAPAPSVDCSSLISNMADCLSFVSNGSTTTKPEGHCCSGLKTVLKADPSCLCEAFKSSAQLGIVLNVTKAATLPAVCKLSAPSLSNCGLSISPAGAPGPASSGGMSAAAPGPSGAGTESELSPAPAPAPSPGNSASSLLSISAGSLLLCLLASIFSGF